jgi:hypothetical protein
MLEGVPRQWDGAGKGPKSPRLRHLLAFGIIDYCKLECRYLAMLMTEFRKVCSEGGISPQEWRGAGWLASALLKKHGVPKRPLSTQDCTSLPLRQIGPALRAWPVSRCRFGRAYCFNDQSEPSRTVGPKTAFGCDAGGGRWEDVTRHVSFEWKTKRDPMRIAVSDDGFVRTFPLKNSIFAESEGYEPADFDRLIEISGESGAAVETMKICC